MQAPGRGGCLHGTFRLGGTGAYLSRLCWWSRKHRMAVSASSRRPHVPWYSVHHPPAGGYAKWGIVQKATTPAVPPALFSLVRTLAARHQPPLPGADTCCQALAPSPVQALAAGHPGRQQPPSLPKGAVWCWRTLLVTKGVGEKPSHPPLNRSQNRFPLCCHVITPTPTLQAHAQC